MPLEPYIVSMPALGVSTFDALQMIAEWKAIDFTLMQQLLAYLQASRRFDFIVVEGRYEYLPFATVWDLNGDVIWLLLDDWGHMFKSQFLFQKWINSEEDRVRWRVNQLSLLVNRFTGTLVNHWAGHEGAITGFLPYIPDWKQMNRAEQWLQSTIFESILANWVETHLHLTGRDSVRSTVQ